MSVCWHGSFDSLGILHVKLFEHILGVLGLTYESSFLHLLDLKSKKELQLTQDISNLFVMTLLNS
jgi:hypothetical protein